MTGHNAMLASRRLVRSLASDERLMSSAAAAPYCCRDCMIDLAPGNDMQAATSRRPSDDLPFGAALVHHEPAASRHPSGLSDYRITAGQRRLTVDIT